MRYKKHSNNNRNNNRGRGKYRNNSGGGNDTQSLARQKKHAMTQKEKYLTMARDAQVNGERVDAEYYYQHVEHYSRTLAEIAAKEPQPEKKEEKPEVADEEVAENAGNVVAAEALEEPVEEKPTRGRKPRQKKADKAKDEEIPLPMSVIPEEAAATS